MIYQILRACLNLVESDDLVLVITYISTLAIGSVIIWNINRMQHILQNRKAKHVGKLSHFSHQSFNILFGWMNNGVDFNGVTVSVGIVSFGCTESHLPLLSKIKCTLCIIDQEDVPKFCSLCRRSSFLMHISLILLIYGWFTCLLQWK